MHAAPVLRSMPVPRWQIVLAAALLLAGFFTAIRIRTELEIRAHLNVPSARLEELAILLREQERRRGLLEDEIATLRAQVAEVERAAAEGKSSLSAMNRALRDLRMLAGMVDLEGPGVVIEMRDSTQPMVPGDDPNKTILHYTDIYAVVNDLWAAGADAVAVNGVRIMSRTGFSCVGTTILCNTKRIAPPYRITAIGNPDLLLTHVRRASGPLDVLRIFGFPVKTQAAARVTVPAYGGIAEFTFAKPLSAVPH